MKALESNAKRKIKLLNKVVRRPGHPFSIILARERQQEQAGAVAERPCLRKAGHHLPHTWVSLLSPGLLFCT